MMDIEFAVSARDVETDFAEAAKNPDLVAMCVRICNEHMLTAESLSSEWDLLTMNKGKRQVTLEALGELDARVRDARIAKRAKSENRPARPGGGQFSARTKSSTFSKDTLLGGILDGSTPAAMRKPAIGRTPQTTVSSSGPSPLSAAPSPSGAFSTRADAGKLVTSLNAALGVTPAEEQLEVSIEAGPSAALVHETYMWERLEQRAQMLDGQLARLERHLDGHPNFPRLAPLMASSAEEVTVVGRVCTEGEGKLNLQSIFLEGSRSSSNGCRVRLDLASCPEFALFPGQVVAVIGMNTVGHTFVAHKIVSAIPPRAEPAPPPAQPSAVTLLTAAGPYSTTDDLTYAPLTALLARAAEVRPDALVLVGPFVDEQHPTVTSPDLPVTFDDLFDRQIVNRISEFVESQIEDDGKVTQVVLLPSTRDVHHHPVYPQPPMSLPPSVPEHVLPHILLAPNPATVNIGGVRLAASSVDTLFLLGQQELARNAPVQPGGSKPDRMARLASHVLQQRMLLPLFPAPSDERAPLAVDVTANLKGGHLPALPDVLLVPSELAPFAKPCHAGVLAVNPGRLTRKQAGGNYALICVHPPPAVPEAPAEAATADVTDGAADGEAAAPAQPDVIMQEALAAASSTDSAAPSAASADAAAPAAAPTEESAAASGVLALQADAPQGLATRAFVEVKRI